MHMKTPAKIVFYAKIVRESEKEKEIGKMSATYPIKHEKFLLR